MSLLTGEVASSGGSLSSEPLRPLSTLAVYNKQLEHLELQDGFTAERELQAFKAHLRAMRLAKRGQDWNWALPLVDAPEEQREEFFAALTRLLERQTLPVCRVRIFALLLELSSVEVAPPSMSSAMSSQTESKSSSASPVAVSFGHHALRVVRDIMPNVVGARDLFITCVDDPLKDVLASMSMQHLTSLFPLLIDILSDPHFTSMIHTDPDADNVFTLMAHSTGVLKNVFQNLLAQISPADGLSRPDARSLVWNLQQCGRLLALLAQSPETATAIHGDGLFTMHLFSNWKLFQRLDSDERWAHDSFTFFRLIGRICRGCPDAAMYMSGGAPSQPSVALVAELISAFKQMPDRPNVEPTWSGQMGGGSDASSGQAKYSQDAFNASLLYCLSALLLNSEKAATLMKERKEGMKTFKDYTNRLFKWIHTYEHGDFLAAVIESLVLLTRNDKLKVFRTMMEDRNYLCNEIHRMFKRLLSLHNSKTTRAHRDALIHALDFMTYYSQDPKIAQGLNHTLVQDYDRLSVIRNLVRYKGESMLVDNDVKLSAARCLTQVALVDLNKQVVDDLVDIIKDVPSTMAPPLNAATARMLHVAFRMAMFEIDAAGGENLGGSGDNCGDLFRKEAAEACAALYATLEHGIVEDKKPVRVDGVTIKYRLAMVKVLMTAWSQPELRQSCESRAAIEVMVKALRAEQNALRWCKNRHETLVQAGRCVDCEEELLKNNFAQPSRMLGSSDELALSPGGGSSAASAGGAGATESITNVLASIRCPRCKDNIHRGRSVIQETYTPLYLEQTWSGHDIRAILETLKQLKEVDLVAFRVLHQGANILEGTTYQPCVTRLLNHRDFDNWNRDLPGRSVKECQAWERQNWVVQQRRLRRMEALEYSITPADRTTAAALAYLQIEQFSALYNYREHDKGKQDSAQKAAWEQSIDASLADERIIYLVVKDSEGTVIGVCGGGPLRDTTYIPSSDSGEGPFAEMYGLYVSLALSEAEAKKIQQKLLSAFSSRMFALGFLACFAKAHRSERLLFSLTKGVDIDPNQQAATIAKRKGGAGSSSSSSSSSSSNVGAGANCALMGSHVKDFLYLWKLSENVWRRTPAHDEFMSLNGLQTFLDFVLRDTIKIAQNFFSTIRESMEEFGDELQASLSRHTEATKSGGALRVPAPGAEGAEHASKANRGSDYEMQLPPPLPVDAYELGDAPLAGSGVLAVLNGKDDHLYKHLFPLTLQNKFRADPQEHNRAEESMWTASLLGTVQENLLTVAANYASASSVYDDSTWTMHVEKKIKAKKSPAADASVAPSVAATPRASVDPGSNAASSSMAAASNAAAAAAIAANAPLESDLLKHQAEGACAAIFRACYTLVVSGSLSVRQKTAKVLSTPANFYKLRCLMASFSYGIRSSILQPVSPPYLCAMSTNFMSLMQELLPETTVGLEEGLSNLEIYEVFFLVLADLFSSLMSLLRSRNEHARDPMHAQRRLSSSEESVMSAATHLCFKLVSRIQQITLFPAGDEYGFMVRANIECRAKAVSELLLRNKPLFQAALFTFLTYDLEQMPERSEQEEDDEAAVQEEAEAAEADLAQSTTNKAEAATIAAAAALALPQRDSMRIHILWILSTFFHVSPAIQRDFLHQYQVSLITMDLGLRPSLLHSLLAAQQQLMSRDKIYQHLVKTGELAGDEFILDHAMVDYATSSKKAFDLSMLTSTSNGLRVLLLTNKAFYLSAPLPYGEEGWGWLEKLALKRREYADIRALRLLYGGQGLQVVRYAEKASKRLSAPTQALPTVYEVYQVQQLGLAQRILDVFSRQKKDDFGCAMAIAPDLQSRPALQRLYLTLSLPNSHQLVEKMLCHILIRHKGKMVPRVLAWLTAGRNAGDGGMLVIAEVDLNQLAAPALPDGAMPSTDVFPSAVKFNLNSLESVDFAEESASMVLGFPEVNLHITFHDDAARQMWRVALKANFIKSSDAAGNWRAAQLPSNQQARLVYATKLL